MSDLPAPETFLSGEPRALDGRRARARAWAGDRLLDARALIARDARQLDALAAAAPAREVLVLSIYRPPARALVAALPALASGRHDVSHVFGSTGDVLPELEHATSATGLAGGKFENLNHLLAGAGDRRPDWVLVVDDDVALPPRFVDRLVGLCERFDLALAQPAQTRLSHAAWSVVRRRPGVLLRETRFVEIGPVTMFRRDAAAELTPFPALRYGWGLDAHWAAVAEERGWRVGIADSLPVRHEEGAVAATYSGDEAVEEARRFLAGRAYVPSARLQETLVVHRRA
ncbi:MAG: hypothetical protein QOJ07_1570 [Thermoleophilaceae bacterium]|nr:hypothetical protein [Thermoleophilaceae bacterium]